MIVLTCLVEKTIQAAKEASSLKWIEMDLPKEGYGLTATVLNEADL